MSLAESPFHSSSSSEDFAALLDAELESTSSGTSPEAEVDVTEDDNDDDDDKFEAERVKRQKVEYSEGMN
ncbi:hypothetical protein Taro_052920 [Colocasia esculenta]|uniref:Uncharacterized protein n=1 Tax=Colocasia esculenta TaxID=4460 RepID=A0A843XJK6_COLES|nr:hypothetical protein [Colocasia esculenta]